MTSGTSAQRGARGLTALVLLLVSLLLGMSLVMSPAASAATGVVSLTAQGPNPGVLVVTQGDVVRFTNNDLVTHRVTGSSGWAYDSGPLEPGVSAVTPALNTAATLNYTDSYSGVIGVPTTSTGQVVVQAAPPPPPPTTASPKPQPKPTPTATRAPVARPPAATTSPRPVAGAPRATDAPTVVAGGRGTATLPGFLGGGLPVLRPTKTRGPLPSVATVPTDGPILPAPNTATGSSTPVPTYADKSTFSQPSSHGYGLPAALAVVGIAGIASLMVRFLLSQPIARRHREEALERPIVKLE